MKTRRTIFLGLTILIGLCAQVKLQAQDNEKDKTAIIETAKNYIEGAYAADADRMQKAIWPELNKILPIMGPDKKLVLYYNTYSQLIENVRNLKPDNSDKKINISVESVMRGMAAVKITSADFNDFLQLAYINGEWKIINVLWTWGEDSRYRNKSIVFDPEKEKNAIIQCGLDYIDGYYEANAERMTKAIHPELNKVNPVLNPKTGKGWFGKMSSSMLISATANNANEKIEKEKRNIQVKILDIMDGLASLEVSSALYDDYMQLAKIDGVWKIINVLWKSKPMQNR